MGFYEDQVLPRMIDRAMSRGELKSIRARVAASLHGDVLEVGFGSGLNVPHYPPDVTRVRAVDPATVGRKLAAKRVASSSVPVEYIGLDGQTLSLESDSVDQVLTTWTLCSIPDVDRALSEIRRVLRPGGTFHFAEQQFRCAFQSEDLHLVGAKRRRACLRHPDWLMRYRADLIDLLRPLIDLPVVPVEGKAVHCHHIDLVDQPVRVVFCAVFTPHAQRFARRRG